MSHDDLPEHKQRFIDDCTQRDMAQFPMPRDELVQRMDVVLNQLKENMAANDNRLPVSAANCLRGALIRLSQAYSDEQVSRRVYELVSLTLDITGI